VSRERGIHDNFFGEYVTSASAYHRLLRRRFFAVPLRGSGTRKDPSKPGGDASDEDARFCFGAAARDVSSQRYSLSQAGREGRHDTPPPVETTTTRHAGDQVTQRGAEEKEISLHR